MLLKKDEVLMGPSKALYFHFLANIKESVFLGFLPVVNDSNNYYCMKYDSILKKDIIQELINNGVSFPYYDYSIKAVSPVFGGHIEYTTEEEFYALEEQRLHKEKVHLSKGKKFSLSLEKIEKIIKYKEENPYILFFHGCDDGHHLKRFKDHESAMEFLELVETFEDVLSEGHVYRF